MGRQYTVTRYLRARGAPARGDPRHQPDDRRHRRLLRRDGGAVRGHAGPAARRSRYDHGLRGRLLAPARHAGRAACPTTCRRPRSAAASTRCWTSRRASGSTASAAWLGRSTEVLVEAVRAARHARARRVGRPRADRGAAPRRDRLASGRNRENRLVHVAGSPDLVGELRDGHRRARRAVRAARSSCLTAFPPLLRHRRRDRDRQDAALAGPRRRARRRGDHQRRLAAGLPGHGHRHGQGRARGPGARSHTTAWTWSIRMSGFTAADFQRHAYAVLPGIAARGRIGILVGGTGLYLRAVARGVPFDEASVDAAPAGGPGGAPGGGGPDGPGGGAARASRRPSRLARTSPTRGASSGPSSALAWSATRCREPPRGYPGPMTWLGLHVGAEIGRQRILDRAADQFASGLVEEAVALRARFGTPPRAFSAFGYFEAFGPGGRPPRPGGRPRRDGRPHAGLRATPADVVPRRARHRLAAGGGGPSADGPECRPAAARRRRVSCGAPMSTRADRPCRARRAGLPRRGRHRRGRRLDGRGVARRSWPAWPTPPAPRWSARNGRTGATSTPTGTSARAGRRSWSRAKAETGFTPAGGRRRAVAQSAARARGAAQGQGPRPQRPDPRHLRPARPDARGPPPGGAGPARVPAAAPDAPVDPPLAHRWRHRHPRAGRDAAGDRPPGHPREDQEAAPARGDGAPHPRHDRALTRAAARAERGHRGLHERRQVHDAQRARRQRGGARGGQALRHARSHEPLRCASATARAPS